MIVGTVREIKVAEHRVGITPEGADTLVRAGHRVLVESDAGTGAGFDDESYRAAGAEVVPDAGEVWRLAELLVKVKEPLAEEFGRIRSDQLLFMFLHLAAAPELTKTLIESGAIAVAYETVQLSDGTLPLLAPMSHIAGRMATEVAAQWLRKPGPGRGKLLSGLPGAPPARVVILGAGTVSTNACAAAVALGAQVTVMDERLAALRRIEDRWPGRVTTLPPTEYGISRVADGADVLISGVLVPGHRAPKLVSREEVRSMGAGAVIVSVDVDQGGSVATARPTTHDDPVYVEEEVVHYCVANMPGSVPLTSNAALTAATLPYVLALAEGGVDAVKADPALAAGANVVRGRITNVGVALSIGDRACALEDAL